MEGCIQELKKVCGGVHAGAEAARGKGNMLELELLGVGGCIQELKQPGQGSHTGAGAAVGDLHTGAALAGGRIQDLEQLGSDAYRSWSSWGEVHTGAVTAGEG